MKALFKDKLLLLVVAYLLVVLIAIPLTLFTIKKPTDTRTTAAGSASLTYSPSPTQITTGQTVSVDIMVNPATHSVSFVTVDALYDPTKLSVNQSSSFQPNTTAFPVTLEGPVFTPGRIRANLSIGSDPTKAITTTTKVATITFTAESPTNGQEALVHFGESSFVLSVGANDNATDNVLGSVAPLEITITGNDTGNGGPPVTPVPTFGGGTGGPPTNTPIPTDIIPTNTGTQPTPTVDITPQPTCTPIPPECIEDETLPICQNVPPGGYCTGDPTPTPTPIGEATPTPIACRKQTHADVMIVIDSSNSMHGDKIANAKESAKTFIKLLNSDPKNNFGVVSFDRTARVLSPLAGDSSDSRRALDNIRLSGGTCLKCGIEMADEQLSTRGRSDGKKIMIILTDGIANVGGSTPGKPAAEQAALDAVANAATESLVIYTIGIGSAVNQNLLSDISNSTGGLYYFAAQPVEIDSNFKQIFRKISDDLCDIVDTLLTAIPSITIPAGAGQIDPTTIMLVILLFLPLFLLIGHLLV